MSNNNAAASRKRRSSILKTKPRAPFSELEFNPATPDATAKSRRVSFSRKKDVAEFVVNEATTTWRNFYEEQNRTLESSGNESEVRPSAVTHRQFHEVEAEIDHTTLGIAAAGPRAANLTHFNDMNFTEQLASLDCMTANNSVKAPMQHFELSVMGEHSKVFAESFVNPVITEHTGRIEVNFSLVQPAQPSGYDDHDLSDIAKDVERSNPSMIGQNSFHNDFNNRSYYVEVDLNETKGVIRNDISDMSITDTIQSPNVQASVKTSDVTKPKFTPSSLDWEVDKENIVVENFSSPPPAECLNDQNVLVFDGKKLKVANINDKLDDILTEPMPGRKSAVDSKLKPCSNKLLNTSTIGQITDDMLDIQTFSNLGSISEINPRERERQHSLHVNLASHQMSMMESCIENPSMNITNKVLEITGKTGDSLCFDDPVKNVSAVPIHSDASNDLSIIARNQKNGKSLDFNNHDILNFSKEVDALPVKQEKNNLYQNERPFDVQKRKTIILNHNDDLPNFTLDVPPQFDQSKSKGQKNIAFDTEDSVASITTTQAILKELQASHLCMEKNTHQNMDSAQNQSRTIVYNKEVSSADLSMTKVVESGDFLAGEKIMTSISKDSVIKKMTMIPEIFTSNLEKKSICHKGADYGDLSLTQALPIQVKRKTINDIADMSITQSIFPTKANSSITLAYPSLQSRRTINVMADMSITQAVPHYDASEVLRPTSPIERSNPFADSTLNTEMPTLRHRKTINEMADMSITQALPPIAANEVKRQTIEKDNPFSDSLLNTEMPTLQHRKTINEMADMSITQALPPNTANEVKRQTIENATFADSSISIATHARQNRKTISEIADMPITKALQKKSGTEIKIKTRENSNYFVDSLVTLELSAQQHRKTIHEVADMSITQALPPNTANAVKRKTIVNENSFSDSSISMEMHAHQKRKTINEIADMSITQALPQNTANEVKALTVDKGDTFADSSITIEISARQHRKTINEIADMSITQAIPQNNGIEVNRQTTVIEKGNTFANSSITIEKPTMQHLKTLSQMSDKSITQAIPQNTANEVKRETMENGDRFDHPSTLMEKPDRQNCKSIKEMSDISITLPLTQNKGKEVERQAIVAIENDNTFIRASIKMELPIKDHCNTVSEITDMSITHAIPQKYPTDDERPTNVAVEKGNSLNDTSSLLMPKPIIENVQISLENGLAQDSRTEAIVAEFPASRDISRVYATESKLDNHTAMAEEPKSKDIAEPLFMSKNRDSLERFLLNTTNEVSMSNEKNIKNASTNIDQNEVYDHQNGSRIPKDYIVDDTLLAFTQIKTPIKLDNTSVIEKNKSPPDFNVLCQSVASDIRLQIDREMKLVQEPLIHGSSGDASTHDSLLNGLNETLTDLPKQSDVGNITQLKTKQEGLKERFPSVPSDIKLQLNKEKPLLKDETSNGTGHTNRLDGFTMEQSRNHKSIGKKISTQNLQMLLSTELENDLYPVTSGGKHSSFESGKNIDCDNHGINKIALPSLQVEATEIDDTNELIDILTEVTDEMERNLLESAKKIHPTERQKILTEEDLDMMISSDPASTIQSNLKESPKNVDGANSSDKHPSFTSLPSKLAKESFKKRLTITEILDQTERIKSLSKTINLIDTKPSPDRNSQQDSYENVEADLNKGTPSTFDDSQIRTLKADVRNNTIRLSKDIVKSLNFEDEDSLGEVFIDKAECVKSSLVKMHEMTNFSPNVSSHSAKIIPQMHEPTFDLVKPNADLPFTTDPQDPQEEGNFIDSNKTSHSAHNISNLNSNATKLYTKEVVCTAENIFQDGTVIKKHTSFNQDYSHTEFIRGKNHTASSETAPTIIFDYESPLNNIHVAAVSEVSKDDKRSDAFNPLNNVGVNIEKVKPAELNEDNFNNTLKRGFHFNKEIGSETPLTSGPTFQQQVIKATEPSNNTPTISKLFQTKSTNNEAPENQTNIDEFLENTSHITLVDDTLDDSTSVAPNNLVEDNEPCSTMDNAPQTNISLPNHNVKIAKDQYDNGDTADEGIKTDNICLKETARKRSLSPTRHVQGTTLETVIITPNPPRKIHKMSSSPKEVTCSRKTSFKGNENPILNQMHTEQTSPEKGSLPVSKSPAQAHSPKYEKSHIVIESFHSSVRRSGQSQNVDVSVLEMDNSSDVGSKDSQMPILQQEEFQACTEPDSLGSMHGMLEDIIDKIDQLPFMRTWCCKWERADSSSWSFLLMHAAVRLRVSFATDDVHTIVTPSTPVREVQVETLRRKSRHPVAELCIDSCVAALRAAAVAAPGACTCAIDVPDLLERCAATVRDAARFGRAMQHASMHLAYRLQDDVVRLQVANIPLRSIWELDVRVRTEDVPTPRPRAVEVLVEAVHASESVSQVEVDALLAGVPGGWMHVPETIWTIFKYLKNKPKDDLKSGISAVNSRLKT